MAPWEPANNGNSKRIWFLFRRDSSLPFDDQYHFGRDGRLVRYKSYETAKRAADRLNRKER